MAWTSLSNRLNSLPLVIAGPILRRVENNSVTVWIALRASATVKLEIMNIAGSVLSSATETTVSLGTNLHVLAITTKPSPVLLPDTIYKYNLNFQGFKAAGISIQNGDLKTAKIIEKTGDTSSIAYTSKGYDLPTFCLPPSDINNLRILHGSCRKPHGQGFDALWVTDELIFGTVNDATKRPHQLFLTGDQIYADDVSDLLLYLICDAQNAILGWVEPIPLLSENCKMLPGKRGKFVRDLGKLTPEEEDAQCHLTRLGEYYMMYLFVWSDILWPKNKSDFPVNANNTEANWKYVFGNNIFDGTSWADERDDLEVVFDKKNSKTPYILEFHKLLAKIRRLFANIPCYMVFDDHDVTDDWNFNKKWCINVYGSTLGKRIITNALASFAVFQNWGNTPEQYDSGKPGRTLLLELAKGTGRSYNTIENYLNLNLISSTSIEMTQDRTGAKLIWDFAISWGNHQVVALDTRTRRSWPKGEPDGISELLSPSAINEQLQNPNSNAKITIVIVPTPLTGVDRVEDELKTLAFTTSILFADQEYWALQKSAKERFLAALKVYSSLINTERRSRIILISGDVHYGFANRLEYWSDKHFESNGSNKTHSTIVQLTASSFKNQSDKTKIGIEVGTQNPHNKGYDGTKNGLPTPKEFWGFNNPSKGKKKIGTESRVYPKSGAIIEDWNSNAHPILVSNSKKGTLTLNPDWVYRIDYFMHDCPPKNKARENSLLVTMHKEILVKAGFGSNLSAIFYLNHGQEYGVWQGGKTIVGRNNIGEIFFEWGTNESDKFVNQWLWWHLPDTKLVVVYKDLPENISSINDLIKSIPAPLTQYRVPLAIGSEEYPTPIPKPIGF